jgi:hypothetical protein
VKGYGTAPDETSRSDGNIAIEGRIALKVALDEAELRVEVREQDAAGAKIAGDLKYVTLRKVICRCRRGRRRAQMWEYDTMPTRPVPEPDMRMKVVSETEKEKEKVHYHSKSAQHNVQRCSFV